MTSDAWRIQLFFAGLLILTLLAAVQLALWIYRLDKSRTNPPPQARPQ